MDTVSHALIGIAIAGFSGNPLTLNDPVYMAAVLGAQAPDFDIIAQLRGSFAYLRQHRSFSHSLPGIVMWSFAITAGIMAFMPQASFTSTFTWAFLGGLSHISIDYFNTHGTAILWPFRTERKSCHLLNVFDPVLLTGMLSIYGFKLPMLQHAFASMAVLVLYVGIRAYLRHRAYHWLRLHFKEHQLLRITVMPSLKRLFFWDFVIETKAGFFVGKIGALHPVVKIKINLPSQNCLSYITIKARKTPLGDFFHTFSPFAYYEEKNENNLIKVMIYDLRYLINEQFRHTATIIFNQDYIPIDSYMLSYGRKIKVPC